MYTIMRMPEFDAWIENLRDRYTRLRLLRRLEKAQRGLLGGGYKSTQQSDIAAAHALAATLEE